LQTYFQINKFEITDSQFSFQTNDKLTSTHRNIEVLLIRPHLGPQNKTLVVLKENL